MKASRFIPIALSILFALALCLLFGGCASSSRNTYKAVSVSYVAVDTAMKLWGEQVRAGKVTLAQEVQVKRAYESWQQAAVVALDAAEYLQTHPDAKLNLETASGLWSASKQELMNLIHLYAPNLNLTL